LFILYKNLLNISLENRKEQLLSVEKDINRLKKELIINVKKRDNILAKNFSNLSR
jgi:hypothetical protein